MSYARFGSDSDVYVFANGRGFSMLIQHSESSESCETLGQLLAWLEAKQAEGLKISAHTLARVGREMREDETLSQLREAAGLDGLEET